MNTSINPPASPNVVNVNKFDQSLNTTDNVKFNSVAAPLFKGVVGATSAGYSVGGAAGNIIVNGGNSESEAGLDGYNGGNAGTLNMSGGNASLANDSAGGNAGSINTSGAIYFTGGSINTSASDAESGGSINTSGGGGSIDTTSGYIELGPQNTRTTLQITSTDTRTISLGDTSGTIVVLPSGELTTDGTDLYFNGNKLAFA